MSGLEPLIEPLEEPSSEPNPALTLIFTLSKRIGMEPDVIRAAVAHIQIQTEILEAWLLDRASNNWMTPKRQSIATGNWFFDLQNFARIWNQNRPEESGDSTTDRAERLTELVRLITGDAALTLGGSVDADGLALAVYKDRLTLDQAQQKWREAA